MDPSPVPLPHDWTRLALVAAAAYAIGCCSTGYYLVRAMRGLDIRQTGSGSAGARNVGRVLGVKGFLLTALGDALKGGLAVWGTQQITRSPELAGVALVAVVAGHVWPAQLRFHGGKGVAPGIAGLLAYDWRLAAGFLLVFACGYAVARRMVLPALVAATCLPAMALWPQLEPWRFGVAVLVALLLLFAHRKNMGYEFATLRHSFAHAKRARY